MRQAGSDTRTLLCSTAARNGPDHQLTSWQVKSVKVAHLDDGQGAEDKNL